MRARGLCLALLMSTGTAAADDNDLALARLGTKVTDAAGNVTYVGDAGAFRALASQLGTVLAPHLLTPADTIGFAGFQLTVDYTQTAIDRGAAYWRALEGPAPSSMSTIGVFARKGIWFPLPSFEVGAGAVHLRDSATWAGQLYAKLALHEGYDDLPIPSLAVRGAVSRMVNQRELDLTVASIDVSVSKHIGIGGTWNIDPYAGWDTLIIVPRSEVIDATPNAAEPTTGGAPSSSFGFLDQQPIVRNKLFLGARLKADVLVLTLEGSLALAGSSIDDRLGTNAPCTAMTTTASCDAADTAKLQSGFSLSAGFEF